MAIGIYNFIRRSGGYRTAAHSEVGGIPLTATRYTYAGKRNFSITRPGPTEWSMKFVVVSPRYVEPDTKKLWLRKPSTTWVAEVGEDFIHGRASVFAITGNYDSYKHDMALLRMFDSVWGEPCA